MKLVPRQQESSDPVDVLLRSLLDEVAAAQDWARLAVRYAFDAAATVGAQLPDDPALDQAHATLRDTLVALKSIADAAGFCGDGTTYSDGRPLFTDTPLHDGMVARTWNDPPAARHHDTTEDSK